MLTKTILAASALLSMTAAVPMQQLQRLNKLPKRDVVWETKTTWDVKTVDVTTTIWLEPGEHAPTETPAAAPNKAHFGPGHYGHHGHHGHGKPKVTSHILQTTTVQPVAPPPPAETPSSPYVAPTPNSPAPAPSSPAPPAYSPPAPSPEPSPQPQPSPSPEPQPQPAPSPKPPQNGGGSYPNNGLSGAASAGTEYTGDFTWYQTGLGACGITSAPSDHIVAISESLFDQYDTGNPNENPLCGKTVTLTGANGSTYPAKIVDRCTGCALSDLDLSQDFFNLVTNNGDGRVGGMKWVFD